MRKGGQNVVRPQILSGQYTNHRRHLEIEQSFRLVMSTHLGVISFEYDNVGYFICTVYPICTLYNLEAHQTLIN